MIEVDCSPFKVLNELIQLKKVLNDLGRWAFYIVPFFGGLLHGVPHWLHKSAFCTFNLKMIYFRLLLFNVTLFIIIIIKF